MVKFLHETYPKVHITLHAGELGYGMVPPDGLCCISGLLLRREQSALGMVWT